MQVQELTRSEISEIRVQVTNLRAAREYTNTNIARASGVAPSTLSQFLSDSYPGDVNKVAISLQNWLKNHEEIAALTEQLGRDDAFIKTETASRMWHVLRYCMAAGDMGAIIGAPGMGKSVTAKAFCRQDARAYYLSMSPSSGDIVPCLVKVSQVLNRSAHSQARYLRAVIDDELRKEKSLVIVDEAQHLTVRALEELRAIHDETAAGLVLMGNKMVVSRLSGPAQAAQFAQLNSRIGMKMSVTSRPPEADVRQIAEGLGTFGEPGMNFLIRVSKKHGALRSVVKTIKLARMLDNSAGHKGGDVSLDHLQAAYSQLS